MKGFCKKGAQCTYKRDGAKQGTAGGGQPTAAPAQRGRDKAIGRGRKGRSVSSASRRSRSTGGRSIFSRRTSRSTERSGSGRSNHKKRRKYPRFGGNPRAQGSPCTRHLQGKCNSRRCLKKHPGPCRYHFSEGFCSKGDKCNHAHVQITQKPRRNKSKRKHSPHKKQASYSRTKSKQHGNSPHKNKSGKGHVATVLPSHARVLANESEQMQKWHPESQSDSQMYECYFCEKDTRYQLRCKVCARYLVGIPMCKECCDDLQRAAVTTLGLSDVATEKEIGEEIKGHERLEWLRVSKGKPTQPVLIWKEKLTDYHQCISELKGL